MEKVKNNKILLIVFGVLLIMSLILYNFKLPDSKEKDISNNSEYQLVTDYSRFFTVNSCVYKYVEYLQSQDFDSLLKVLDHEYVSNNGINKNNIYNFLPNLSNGMYNFVSKKMYYKKLSNSYISYYVYGYIIEDTIDSTGTKQYYSYQVNLDIDNQTFNIAPYNGDLFKEGNNG